MARLGRGGGIAALVAGALVAGALLAGALALAGGGPVAARAAGRPIVAVLDFGIVNTSPLPTTKAEFARLAMLRRELKAALLKSGRYRLVSIAPIRAALAQQPDIQDCNGCELPLARKLGADLVAVGIVQKVSDLILNINLVIEDARTGRIIKSGSADIRGNTTAMWRRGLAFLLSDQILG